MKKFYFLLLVFLFSFQNIHSQKLQLSVYSEVSILTAGPGNELFETFGHSAIHIKDPVLRIDYVFNYGLFTFNQPNFYTNFAKGKLLYRLGVQPYQSFVENYKVDERWMKKQVLDLTQKEKQAFFQILMTNAKQENASYLYDPYFDNCATKLRDITKQVLGNQVTFDTSYSDQHLTLRQLMNIEMPWNTWGSFGINLALGSKLDKEATANEYMYLPDYVYLAFKNASTTTKPLVKKEVTLLNFEEKKLKTKWYNPMFVFSLLFLITIIVTYRDQKRSRRSKWLDFSLFFISGIIGALIVFLWFFTDHSTTPNNFNFLWAFAPNLIVAFLLLKNDASKWVPNYIKVCLLLLLLLPLVWVLKFQLFSITIIPILGALFVRYYFLMKLLPSKK
ncbi:MAG: DUF4105 domain-containing protein [Flavobacteriaceae bacterium]